MKKGEESFRYGRSIYECLLGEKKRERWLKRKTKTRKNEQELKKKKKQNSKNNKEQKSKIRKKRLRACLHGGGGPQVGEVTRFGG